MQSDVPIPIMTPSNSTTQSIKKEFCPTQSDSSTPVTITNSADQSTNILLVTLQHQQNSQSNTVPNLVMLRKADQVLSATTTENTTSSQNVMFPNQVFLLCNSASQPIRKESQCVRCEVCHEWFSNEQELQSHLHLQESEKTFKCPECGKSFANLSNLNKHLLLHNGIRKYKCNLCLKTFSQNINLQKHELVHTGEKPFNCQFCKRSFSEKSNLKAHLLTHTGERPFGCDICGKLYPRKGSLKQHIANVHIRRRKMEMQLTQKAMEEHLKQEDTEKHPKQKYMKK